MAWADFRGKLLGPTDPADAPKDSARGKILAEWKELGLTEEPNVGLNGVHASASPFEAMAEINNWLETPIADIPCEFGTSGALLGLSLHSRCESLPCCERAKKPCCDRQSANRFCIRGSRSRPSNIGRWIRLWSCRAAAKGHSSIPWRCALLAAAPCRSALSSLLVAAPVLSWPLRSTAAITGRVHPQDLDSGACTAKLMSLCQGASGSPPWVPGTSSGNPARIAVIGAAWWAQGWHLPQVRAALCA